MTGACGSCLAEGRLHVRNDTGRIHCATAFPFCLLFHKHSSKSGTESVPHE